MRVNEGRGHLCTMPSESILEQPQADQMGDMRVMGEMVGRPKILNFEFLC